jgi:hypothetical protein
MNTIWFTSHNKGYYMAQIDIEQEIFEFLNYEIRHGIHKEAAETIRDRLAEAQGAPTNNARGKTCPYYGGEATDCAFIFSIVCGEKPCTNKRDKPMPIS